MKKVFLSTVIFALLLSLTTLSARDKKSMWVDAGVGYGFGFTNSYLGQQYTNDFTFTDSVRRGSYPGYAPSDTNAYNVSYKNIFGSLGSGLNFGVSLGFGLNDYFDVGLNFSYLLGLNTEVKGTENSKTNNIHYYDSTYYSYPTYGTIRKIDSTSLEQYSYSETNKYSGGGVLITPFIKLNAGMKTLNPYARFGLILGFINGTVKTEGSSTTTLQKFTPNPRPYPTSTGGGSIETKYSGGISIGFNGAAGIEYNMSKTFSLFLEANLISMAFKPSQKQLTYNENYNDPRTGDNYQISGTKTVDLVDESSKVRDETLRYNSVKIDNITITKNGIPVTDLAQIMSHQPTVRNDIEQFQFGSFGVRAGIRLTLFQF